MKAKILWIFLTIVLPVLIVALGIYWKYSVWSECRLDHSLLYCLTIID